MKKGSLFLPLQKLKEDSLLLSACMYSVYINKQLLVDGLNSLDGVEESFEIGITKTLGSEEKVKVNTGNFR